MLDSSENKKQMKEPFNRKYLGLPFITTTNFACVFFFLFSLELFSFQDPALFQTNAFAYVYAPQIFWPSQHISNISIIYRPGTKECVSTSK